MKKYFAMFKYLFFPFLMANSTGTDLMRLVENHQYVSIKTESADFRFLGSNAGFWKINTTEEGTQQNLESAPLMASNSINGATSSQNTKNEFLASDKLFMFKKYNYALINN